METGNLLIDAQTAFARQRRQRRRARALGWLRRQRSECTQLASLDQELGQHPPAHRRRVGLQAIPLDSVIGTAEPSKARAFDAGFRAPETSRLRWERLWMANRKGASLPAISVYQVGDRHYVDDGHHRVSVARSLGMASIDAEVVAL